MLLNSAHCTRNNPFFIVVGLGSSYRNRGGITVDVDEFFQHPNYNPQNYDFDFSLLKLHEAVRYTRYIQPAVLPTANTVFPVGTQCTVSGWGLRKFDDEDSPPKQLLAAEIEISDFRYCKGNYSKVSNVITDRMICAGTLDGSRDACLGDSVRNFLEMSEQRSITKFYFQGGPLVCKGVLYGVVSFGHGCALKNFPGIYSKITSALPWIKKVARIP